MKFKIPHVFIFLFYIIVACSILSYLIPSGSFERKTRVLDKIEQVVVVPGSYQKIPKHYSLKGIFIDDNLHGFATPVSLLSMLNSVPKGMAQSAVLIFFVFIIGAVFNVIFKTGAIHAVLFALIRKFKNSPVFLFFLIYTLVSIGSSFMGIHLEVIALIPIFLLLARETGYDRMFGLGLAILPVWIGWSTGTTNPFTVQIAQQIAELPIGSGLGFRFVLFIICLLLGFAFLMRYGNQVKNNQRAPFISEHSVLRNEIPVEENQVISSKHIYILVVVIICYTAILLAVQTTGWGLLEMSGGFIGIGILISIIHGMSGDEFITAFIKGLELMIIPALVVGIARGISVVMQEGQIMDTILFYASNGLSSYPKIMAAEGMLVFQSFLNFFVPSASGQALVSMPLMTPLADLLGLSRQTAVLAYILGDGLSNMIIPTNGVLMAMLGIANVPFEKWFRFVIPLFSGLIFIALLTMGVSVLIGY